MKRIPATALFLGFLVCLSGYCAEAPKAEIFDSKGVSISYTVEGQGEPVILIHGLGSSGQINWRAPGVVKELSSHYRVITLDLRGHGHSGKPEKESDYGVEMCEDVIRLMDHLGIKKAHIVGYSMGRMITMKLVTLHPERFKSAVLGGMGILREGSVLQDIWEKMPDREGRLQAPPACVRSLGALAVTETAVKAIHIPVEVIVGDRDPVRRMYVEPLERIRTDWPVKLVPDAGHINCIFKKEFREDIREWLDRQGK